MKYSIPAALVAVALATGAYAGTISGKVSGAKGESVVYIEAIAGKTFPAPTQHAQVDQVHLQFSPHVLVILKGTTVDFKNEDAVGHNIYWPAINYNRKLAHNMGTWPQGESKSFTFNDEGMVPLLCNVHPDMSGYILVVSTPYYALTDKQGGFTIKDVPPGHYTLKTWNERWSEKVQLAATQAVTVGSGEVNVAFNEAKR